MITTAHDRSPPDMGSNAKFLDLNMEFTGIPGTGGEVSRIALGTWAIGGWKWGGSDAMESIWTLRAALDRGITLIDTAPVYGFGRSEEIVGKALSAPGLRSRAVIATKAGLEWRDGQVFRNASRARILHEVDESLARLRTDYIDIYQVHWPDPPVPIEETASAMAELYRQGKDTPRRRGTISGAAKERSPRGGPPRREGAHRSRPSSGRSLR